MASLLVVLAKFNKLSYLANLTLLFNLFLLVVFQASLINSSESDSHLPSAEGIKGELDDDEVTIEVESEADIEREIRRSILELQLNQKREKGHRVGAKNGNDVTAVSTVYESPLQPKVPLAQSTKTKTYRVKVSCLKAPDLPLQVAITNATGENNKTFTRFQLNPTVEIVNATHLLQNILYVNANVKNRGTASNCTLVYFYAPWCPFSAKGAPHFNALPRAFPTMRIVALDSVLHPTINTYFGIISVPSILLFHNGKIISKFNDTIFTLTKFADYIHAYTDLKSDSMLNVTSSDFKGPIPSVVKEEIDIWLFVAWAFILFCLIHYLCESEIWRRMIELVRTTWREAEAQHEHTD